MDATQFRSTFRQFPRTTLATIAVALAAAAALTAYLVEHPTPRDHFIRSAEAATAPPAQASGDPSVPRAESVFERSPAGVEEPPATF